MSNGLRTRVFSLAIASLFLIVLLVGQASAEIKIKTMPQQSVMVADGITVYGVDVYADTTQMPETIFVASEWDVVVPSALRPYITITSADLPIVNDFFEGFDMMSGFNFLDSTLNGNGELDMNSRITDIISHGSNYGPMNKQGYLGTYHFTLNKGFVGNQNFNLNDVLFNDQNTAEYRDSNGGVNITNDVFTVVNILEYTSISPGQSNKKNSFNVTGAKPLGAVDYYYATGSGSGGSTVPGCPNLVFSMNNPTYFGTANANTIGDASLSKQVPANARNVNVKFQSVDKSTCRITPVYQKRFS